MHIERSIRFPEDSPETAPEPQPPSGPFVAAVLVAVLVVVVMLMLATHGVPPACGDEFVAACAGG